MTRAEIAYVGDRGGHDRHISAARAVGVIQATSPEAARASLRSESPEELPGALARLPP